MRLVPAIDCEWNDWQIGECSKTCGGGSRTNSRTKEIEEAKVADEEGTAAGKIAGAECSSRLPPANPVHAACAPGWGPVAIRNRPGLGVSRCPIGRARATQLRRNNENLKHVFVMQKCYLELNLGFLNTIHTYIVDPASK